MKSDFIVALTQLAAERGLPREIVLSAIEAALVSAYRKDSITANQNVSVKLDPGTGDVTVNILKTVVEEVTDEQTEITLKDAKKFNPEVEMDGTVVTESMPHTAGRIAAQTAKQVVMQRLREAEREIVFMEYEDKEGEVFSVNIQRVEPKQVIVALGRAEAVLPISEQVPIERYRSGNKMKVLLKTVARSSKGPELIVSRADTLLLRRLFEMEVPEIFSGAVEIDSIAREPGSRSKVAVRATQDGVDPVGSCVGLRGVRIQNIVNELHGEKIDVVEWNKEAAIFLANALSPAQVMKVELNVDDKTATAVVPERQLSLAIGKEGQNVRLAARLTGWRVDIKSNVEYEAEVAERAVKEAEAIATGAVAVEEPPVAEEPVEAEAVAEEPVATEQVDEEVEAEPAAAEEAKVETKEAPVAEIKPAPVEEPVVAPKLAPQPAPVREPVAAAEKSASLRDVPEAIWTIRRARRSVSDSDEPGQIRFAEDIAGLRGGVTASRRNRRRDDAAATTQPEAPKRKTKAGKRRR
ncbi:MAG: transcription termination/antitermination protein NusA [Chloroflexi bacterium]|nr:transcription termination/antitermination protein NusA [Chloroflexota bacterium]